MKRKIPKWILFLAIPCFLVTAGYIALIQYYKINIPYGTWINDIYCTGMSSYEVEGLLLQETEADISLIVIDDMEKEHQLVLDSSVYEYSYHKVLNQALFQLGTEPIFSEKYISLEPEILLNQENFQGFLENQAFFSVEDCKDDTPRIRIEKTEQGYELIDFRKNILLKEKASKVIFEAVLAGKERISLSEEGCYDTPKYNSAELVILEEYEKIQSFCNRIKLELTIGGETAYVVDASVLKDWIWEGDSDSDGKNGALLLDESKVKEYVKKIAKEVTTYFGEPWDFVTHDGETVQVKAGNFGRVLKNYALEKMLIESFKKGQSGSYELEFLFYPDSAKEIEHGGGYGGSYIEVDIEGQTVYVYIDYELVLESPCVTGDVRLKRETPKGVFYIEYKQRNRTLIGPDYRTPVSYWMHFYNHCGFHDAGWRRKFGEDIYLTDGSHGCVNMPPAKAKELYSLAYSGMPVIVY